RRSDLRAAEPRCSGTYLIVAIGRRLGALGRREWGAAPGPEPGPAAVCIRLAEVPMSKDKQKTAITPTRAEDYPEWYQQVIAAADLAENSEVRGCMVIKPWGYAL